jgi:hypothetical protein
MGKRTEHPHEKVATFFQHGVSCKRNKQPHFIVDTEKVVLHTYRMITNMLDFLRPIAVVGGPPISRYCKALCRVYGAHTTFKYLVFIAFNIYGLHIDSFEI